MYLNKYILLFAISVIFSISSYGQYGGYIFSNFTDQEGLPHSTVMHTMEDSDGYIWVKSWNGICFFDGINFHKVDLTDEYGASKINQTFFDFNDGKMWISNIQGTLWAFDKFQNRYIGDSLIITEKLFGNVEGKALFTDLSRNTFFYIDSLRQKQEMFIQVFDKDGFVEDARVISLVGSTVICDIEDSYVVGKLYPERENSLRVNLCGRSFEKRKLSQHGELLFYKKSIFSNGCEFDTLLNFNSFAELGKEDINHLLKNGDDIWIYTKSSQLFVFNLINKNLIKIPPVLWNYELFSINKDRSGNVWLGTANGLVRAEKSNKWKFYKTNQDTINDERILMLVKDKNGRVWTGGTNGKIFSFNSTSQMDKTYHLPYSTSLAKNRYQGRVFGMNLDKQDNMWISLKGEYSLHRININNFSLNTEKIELLTNAPKLQKFLRTIHVETKENFWIGGYNVLYSFNPQNNSLKAYFDKKLIGTIWKISCDQEDNVWLGSTSLIKYNTSNNSFDNYYIHEKSPNDKINYVFSVYIEPSEKYLWAGSFGNGLHRFDMESETFDTKFTEQEGLADNIVYAIYPDKEDRLWLATMDGISYYDKNSNTSVNFDLPMNFEVTEINSEAHFQDTITGEILLGGMNGAIGFYPDELISYAKKTKLNPIFIHQVKSGGKLLDNAADVNDRNIIDLPEGEDQIEFEFVSPNPSPVKIQYRYKLEGVDKNWIYPIKDRRYLSYKNLDDKAYTFTVQSRIYDQKWERNSKEVQIKVNGIFWETTTFKILLGLILLSIVSYILFLRFRNVLLMKDTQRKELEKQSALLQSLNTQMNPHFLYNSLNSINHFIVTNEERKANEYLSDFANLMRKVLNNSKYDKISLADELECIDLYVKLEQLRMSNGFTFNKKIDPSLDIFDIYIPFLIIQPFVENAIWHGLRHSEKPGLIDLEITRKDADILCIIKDNGIGLKKSRQLNKKIIGRTSTGIENVRKRLEIFNTINKSAFDLDIFEIMTDDKSTGTQVNIIMNQKK